jgi:hypothetical protein
VLAWYTDVITAAKEMGSQLAQRLITQGDACSKLGSQQACLAEPMPTRGSGSPTRIATLPENFVAKTVVGFGVDKAISAAGDSRVPIMTGVLAAGLALAALAAAAAV